MTDQNTYPTTIEESISVLVGCKNNVEYTKEFYTRFRKLYPNVELVLVSYGSTDETDHFLLTGVSEGDPNSKLGVFTNEATFADTFNMCAKLATKPLVVFMHNDIVVAPNLLENLLKHATDAKRVVGYVTVEPPIFSSDHRVGKILRNFGSDFQTMKDSSFLDFCKMVQTSNMHADQTESGYTFFHMVDREFYLNIGGMDNLFDPFFCEDSDLFKRYEILGIEGVVAMDALCYHFVSKTSRFSEEYKDRTKKIEENSVKNLFRKWGNHKNKYDVGLVVQGSNEDEIERFCRWVEPMVTSVYSSANMQGYIESEQPKTKFNLKERLVSLDRIRPHDVVIYLDLDDIRNGTVHPHNVQVTMVQLGSILDTITEGGTYTYDGMTVVVSDDLKPINDQLASLSSDLYSLLYLSE